MAGGRDLKPRAPRWFDWLVCSSGLAAAICFIWRLLCNDESPGLAPSPGTVLPRLLGAAMLPLLVALSALAKAATRLVERN